MSLLEQSSVLRLQDKSPLPENYSREWVVNTSQRQDENGNLMWEKQSAKDRKAGIAPTPTLNFPAGGYWKYTAINPDGPLIRSYGAEYTMFGGGKGGAKDEDLGPQDAVVFYEVPETFTDYNLGKDYTGKADKDFKGMKKHLKHSREYLKKIEKEQIKSKFDAWMLNERSKYPEVSQVDGEAISRDETLGDWFANRHLLSKDDYIAQMRRDFEREARFEGGLGFIATTTAEGGRLPGSLLDTAPVGYYWKRDAEGNDVWVNGRRVPAPLYEGKGLTRQGKVANVRRGKELSTEEIQSNLEEIYPQNISYMNYLSRKYAPDTAGANYSSLPTQTPIGQADLEREDGTKLTRDWTMANIESIDPDTGTMGDPLAKWALSSEGQAVEAERKKEFMKWMYSSFVKEQEEHKGTFMEGKTKPWGFFGVKYPMTQAEWTEAERKKKEQYDIYEAEHKASINVGLDEPGAINVGGVAVQGNGVVLDARGRPTGQVVQAPDDDSDEDSDEGDWFAEGGSDDEINIERLEDSEDDFQDDADTYGRRITSGTGKQTRWDAGK